MNRKFTSIGLLLLLMMPQVQATEIDVGYDSKYVSEGRNKFISGGVYWINGSHNLNDKVSLTGNYGYAASSDIEYDELKLGITYADSIDGFDYYLSYKRVEFFEDNDNDDEISLGLSYSELELFTPFSNLVYGRVSDGFFVDVGAKKEFRLSEKVTVTPYAVVAFDFGYAGGDENGHNHTFVGTTVNYELTKTAAISVVLEQTFGGSVIAKEANGTDHFWGGLHFFYSW